MLFFLFNKQLYARHDRKHKKKKKRKENRIILLELNYIMKCNNVYIYIYIFRLQYNGIMPSAYTIEVFLIVIAFVWHELIPPLLYSIIFIVIFWVSRIQ